MMVELDVGDDRDLGPKLEEARVGLVGLGDHPLTRTPGGVRGLAARPRSGQLPAEQKGRVGPDCAQAMGEHACAGGLAVRPGHREQALSLAELGQQLAAVDHALAALARPRQLGVVLGDRGRDDHVGALGHRVGVMPDPRLEPRGPEASEVGALGAVAARHLGAELAGHEREPAHAGAADGDEVEPSARETGH